MQKVMGCRQEVGTARDRAVHASVRRCKKRARGGCFVRLAEAPMRTNIVIDDKLMAATPKATGLRTKREAVEQGLRTLLRLTQQTELRKLRGKYAWEGDLDAMRRDR
jgi:Arc/MetJ family transcription regulator